MKVNLLLAALLFGFSMNVMAKDTDALKVEEQIEIKAPASKVWEKIKNFGDMGAWHPAVAKTDIVYGANNVRGAARMLTLQDGGKIKELLFDYNEKKMSYKYGMMDTVLPVSRYSSSITVIPKGANKSMVVWKGKFKRVDPSSAPAVGKDDATATKTITDIYRSGLENLKKISE